ncbi:Cellulose synthase-like protein G3 [Platanthera guangdongensis]|uniref:Cellulose synthase-like protein G3 n=1 Tax=Platanthera guangdongensis TaxID=2320717 RepID=A0ABR2N0Z6_9ASPA
MAPLHVHHIHPQATLNRIHFYFYSAATIALIYRHFGIISFATPSTLLLLFADLILAFMWLLCQGFRWRPIVRREFPNLLPQAQLQALDVFICTADPFKEPPESVSSTTLSVMAFDYPTDQLSVYVSDDGGSELMLFALMEAAKFARYWLPFCRDNAVMERSPEAYFESSNGEGEAGEMKVMFEGLKERVESAVKRGYVDLSLVDTPEEKEIFMKWKNYTGRDHPSVIQILCESANDKDITGHQLPNLIYISREKRSGSPHHFKAGALNALLRVSEAMTNAPVLLTLDCDMHSNDPGSPKRALCYLVDPDLAPNLSYVQFPQRYRGINADDIYGGEIRRLFLISARGFDGLHGPNYVGTGCFFSRRSLYGPPPAVAVPTNYESKGCSLLRSEIVLQRARNALSCKYDRAQEWGSKIGFRYGSLVEDFNTGYKLHCEGWRSLLCNPDRPAFLGHAPKNLYDSLSQTRRWVVGLYEVAFSRYCPLFYGSIKASLLTGFCYMYFALWGVWCFPIIIYALLPQLALLYDKPLFPKVSDPL